MKNDRIVSKKNYILLIIILIATCGILYYFYLWYGEYSNNWLYKPILSDALFQIKYNEIDDYVIENNNACIYVSYVGNKKTRDFEKKFLNLINNYHINNDILYLNLSEIADDKKIFNYLKEKYTINNYNIFDGLPNILAFKNGLLDDIYFINENNYSINRVDNYLKAINVIEVE